MLPPRIIGVKGNDVVGGPGIRNSLKKQKNGSQNSAKEREWKHKENVWQSGGWRRQVVRRGS